MPNELLHIGFRSAGHQPSNTTSCGDTRAQTRPLMLWRGISGSPDSRSRIPAMRRPRQRVLRRGEGSPAPSAKRPSRRGNGRLHRRTASPSQPDRALLRRSRPGGEMPMFFFLAPVDAPNKKNREDGRRDCEPFAHNVDPRSSNEFRGGVTAC